jgi:hypothetical protein
MNKFAFYAGYRNKGLSKKLLENLPMDKDASEVMYLTPTEFSTMVEKNAGDFTEGLGKAWNSFKDNYSNNEDFRKGVHTVGGAVVGGTGAGLASKAMGYGFWPGAAAGAVAGGAGGYFGGDKAVGWGKDMYNKYFGQKPNPVADNAVQQYQAKQTAANNQKFPSVFNKPPVAPTPLPGAVPTNPTLQAFKKIPGVQDSADYTGGRDLADEAKRAGIHGATVDAARAPAPAVTPTADEGTFVPPEPTGRNGGAIGNNPNASSIPAVAPKEKVNVGRQVAEMVHPQTPGRIFANQVRDAKNISPEEIAATDVAGLDNKINSEKDLWHKPRSAFKYMQGRDKTAAMVPMQAPQRPASPAAAQQQPISADAGATPLSEPIHNGPYMRAKAGMPIVKAQSDKESKEAEAHQAKADAHAAGIRVHTETRKAAAKKKITDAKLAMKAIEPVKPQGPGQMMPGPNGQPQPAAPGQMPGSPAMIQ